MSDLRAAAQRALEALEYHVEQTRPIHRTSEAITALRAALAEPVQEPVAWHYTNNAGASVMHWGPSNRLDADMRAAKDYPHVHKVTPLYAAPPQRKPLTEEEIRRIKPVSPDLVDFRSGVRCAERAHGIGGNK